jgi:hypothetical protein
MTAVRAFLPCGMGQPSHPHQPGFHPDIGRITFTTRGFPPSLLNALKQQPKEKLFFILSILNILSG